MYVLYFVLIYLSTVTFPKEFKIAFKQLHGFSDASERAYAGVVYLTHTHIFCDSENQSCPYQKADDSPT